MSIRSRLRKLAKAVRGSAFSKSSIGAGLRQRREDIFELQPLEGRILLAAEYTIWHTPYIQLGDAAITGNYNGQNRGTTDQATMIWQTILNPGRTTGADDVFDVKYRKVTADTEASWTAIQNVTGSTLTAVTEPNPLPSGEISRSDRTHFQTTITGLEWGTYYEYQVIQITTIPGPSTSEAIIAHDLFRSRSAGGMSSQDESSFSFIAYGDSATAKEATDEDLQFVRTQAQINQLDDRSDVDVEFSLMLGDNVYGDDVNQDGHHFTYDRRLSQSINSYTPDFNARHVEYFAWGNHDQGIGATNPHKGLPGKDNYANPIPTSTTSPAPLTVTDSDTQEHFYSFDYGDAHFIALDSNLFNNQLSGVTFTNMRTWLHNDLIESNALWNIVYFHHPLLEGNTINNYSNSVFSSLMSEMEDGNGDFMVDLVLTGHAHNYQRSKPLTGSIINTNQPEINTTPLGDANNVVKGDGLIHLLVGTGGRNADGAVSGNALAATFGDNSFENDDEAVYGFALIDVSKEALRVRYVGNREGQVFDEFAIHASTATLPDESSEVISLNSTWNYLDKMTNGQASTPSESYPIDDSSDPWYSPNFSISDTGGSSRGAWSSGAGPFEGGVIDGFDGMTTTALMGIGTPNTVTTYLFRRNFNISSLEGVVKARFDFIADDGAVFYVNGVEVHRHNMTSGTITSTTTSSASTPDENLFFTFQLDTFQLNDGDNLIAVELHNQSTSSSDAGFGLKMALIYGDVFVPYSSEGWDYYDEDTATPDGSWKEDVTYETEDWNLNHAAPFGYGSITGAASFGTTVTNTQSGVNYYRRTFTIDDVAAYRNFTLNLRRDDQAVVFINGQEAVRSNMPPIGTPIGTQPTSREISTSEATIARFMVDSKFLKTGTNLIAVEVYQPSGEANNDHVFDAMLTAEPLAAGEYGDFNRDGDIDETDIDQLFAEIHAYERMASINASTSTGLLEELHPHQQFRNPDTRPAFDLNRDGKLNVGDAILLDLVYTDTVTLFETIADFDNDNNIDWDDMAILAAGIAANPQPPGLDLDGNEVQDQRDARVLALFLADFDHDADFDLDDMELLLTAIATTSTSSLYDVDDDAGVDIHDRDMLLFDLLDADFDDDDMIGASDINALVGSLISSSYAAAHDLNMDLKVDYDDLDLLIHVILMTEYGDTNLDGDISIGDLVILAENFNVQTLMGWQHGNFTVDEAVSIGDLTIMAENFGFMGDGGSLERGDATWGLAAQALTAGVDTEFTVSEGEDVGDDLMRYLISLSVDEGVGLISGLTIQIEATDEGTLNQVNEAFGGSFTTIFEDNNLIISYDPNAAPIEQDSQFAWMTNELSMIMQNLENADIIMASFILAQATAFFETVVAQVVLAAGHTATVSGTIVAEDGTQIILDPVTFGEEE